MLTYTGHPLVDVGIATLGAFHDKPDPSTLSFSDLEQVADFMEKHYFYNWPLSQPLGVTW